MINQLGNYGEKFFGVSCLKKQYFKRKAYAHLPMTKTGMKAPQGTGRVVAKADIQNCTRENSNSHLNTNTFS